MKKDAIKSHLLIGHKFLGALLYFKDKNGRGCLNLSFKNKIADFARGTDVPTTKPVPVKLNFPMHLDISYKFQDNFLEVKKIIDGKPEREFYNIPVPVLTSLFILQIKDWHLLDDAESPIQPLVLTPPSQCDSVAVVFSFLGADGQPIAPKEYSTPMGTINLPENGLDAICIGITEDKNNNETNSLIIKLPFRL
ncbi:MAG: hypothetical protein Q8R36_02755 [bacterium]|nr:hypothetical protein [bacterium]